MRPDPYPVPGLVNVLVCGWFFNFSLFSLQPKKKKKPKPQAKEVEAEPEPTPSESTFPPETPETHNGFHANGSLAAEGESLDSLSEQLDSISLDTELDSEPATPDLPDLTGKRSPRLLPQEHTWPCRSLLKALNQSC